MNYQKLEFTNRYGHDLSARLDLPDDGSFRGLALFAHCFTCGKNLKSMGYISRGLTERGIGVFRFDFTGLGESEGDFGDTNFSSNVTDLIDAAAFLANNYQSPTLLIGHSLGGAAVLQAAEHLPDIKTIITIGAPCNPEHVAHLFESAEEEILEKGEAKVLLAGRPFCIKKQFLDDLEDQRMTEKIQGLKRPLLVLHSSIDNTVGIDNAAHIFTSARHPKSFISLDDADHLLTKKSDALYVGQLISAWSSIYLSE